MSLRSKLLLAGAVLIALGFVFHYAWPSGFEAILGLLGASLLGWNLHAKPSEEAEYRARETAREAERSAAVKKECDLSLDANRKEGEALTAEARANAQGATTKEIENEIAGIQAQGRRDVTDAATAMERAERIRRLRSKLAAHRAAKERGDG